MPATAFDVAAASRSLRHAPADALITLDADHINRHGPRLADEIAGSARQLNVLAPKSIK